MLVVVEKANCRRRQWSAHVGLVTLTDADGASKDLEGEGKAERNLPSVVCIVDKVGSGSTEGRNAEWVVWAD